MSRRFILLSISNGWGIRNFIHTGIIYKLSSFAKIGVATTPELMPFFKSIKDKHKISHLEYLPKNETKFWNLSRKIKKFILQSKFQISTAQIKSKEHSRNSLDLFFRILAWKVSKFFVAHWQIKLIEMLEMTLKNQQKTSCILPSILVVCEPFDNRDQQLQRELYSKGVDSISIIPSWDNPSTKGTIFSHTKKIFAWGKIQKKELLKFYPNMSDRQIRLTGVPQFDAHHLPLPNKFKKKVFLSKLRIPLEKNIILYATCPERLHPTEHKIIEDIAIAIEHKIIKKDCHLLVRCHPLDTVNRYRLIDKYKSVTIVKSTLNIDGGEFGWIPPENELDGLAAFIRNTDMCINTASTMSLDALSANKPVINIAYEVNNNNPHKSVARFYNYHHLLPLSESGGVFIAKNKKELVSHINTLLDNPRINEILGDDIYKLYCHNHKDGSVARIVNEIKDSLPKVKV